jgi:hypothetical protein
MFFLCTEFYQDTEHELIIYGKKDFCTNIPFEEEDVKKKCNHI